MSNAIWRLCFRQVSLALSESRRRRPGRRKARFPVRLEELESRLAPASFAIDAQLQISRLDNLGDTPQRTHAVVFFESAVTDYQVLRQGLAAGTDAIVLDSAGDGMREMAAFLAGRHDLTSIGVVAHGAPGALALGTATLDMESLNGYARELAVMGSALGTGGELDLWSCDVGSGQNGAALVRDVVVATDAGVAAADQKIGSAAEGGTWQLDVRTAGARGEVPFSGAALGAFQELLGTWSSAGSMSIPRAQHTATLLGNGKVLAAGGDQGSTADLYDPVTNTWSSAGPMIAGGAGQTATLLGNGKVLVTGAGSSASSATELYDPVSNTWSPAASMSVARYEHTATLLQSGKVLVTGGVAGVGAVLSGAELYDPVSNTWSSAGSMATGRGQHTATLLENGMVLVTGGGFNGVPPIASAELYNPLTNTWTSAGSMANARENGAATLLASGKVLVTGGYNGAALSSAELYDPATNTWTAAASMINAHDQHTATLLGNGQVLVAGGLDNSFAPTSNAELYDPASDTWSSVGSMASARTFQTATLLATGKVLVLGGTGSNFTSQSSAELYDPGLANFSGAWNPAASMIAGRAYQTATLLGSGKVLITGGGTSSNAGSTSSNVQLYDPVNNTWASAAPMAAARSGQTATLLGSGKVLVTGGQGLNSILSSAELYDPITNTWSPAKSMATARSKHTATLLANGKVLVAGGAASAELYDPATNTWSSAGNMIMARDSQAAVLLANGMVLVVGGRAGANTILASAELYDPVSNTWSSAASMATPRLLPSATLLGSGMVLVAGGSDKNANGLPSAELYDPASNSWHSAGSMADGHVAPTATLLANGKVLITGGDFFKHAELYDPARNSWSSAGTMVAARFHQTATLLGNGKVLVAGGLDGNPFGVAMSSAEVYDPAGADSSQSTVSVALATIPLGGQTTITLAARDAAGNQESQGGSSFSFALGAGTGGGVISNLKDNNNGTYTATFTATTVGSITIVATLNGKALTSTPATLTVTSTSQGATHFRLVVPASAIVSTPFKLTLTALDGSNNPTGYAGTVQFSTTDGSASVPANATLTNGTGIFSATLRTQGAQTISASDTVSLITGTSSLIVVSAPPPQLVISGAWNPAASMATPRSGQTATLLPNGKVLVSGGYLLTGPIFSAELYDPNHDTWSSAGSMASARDEHTATLLGNGKVLVAGGYGGSADLSTAELYDSTTNAWSPAASMATARDRFTATLLGNGKVLVVGGANGTSTAISSAELYDPVTNSWSAAVDMATARAFQSATLLSNGKVLVVGGFGASSRLSSAELYDPASNSWSGAGNLANARYGQTATLLASGKVLITGGFDSANSAVSSAELYAPVSNSWSSAGTMTAARFGQAATLLPNGRVLVAGGVGTNNIYQSSAELYDPATNIWSSAGSMGTPRSGASATLLGNGKVLVAGGSNNGSQSSAELYDPLGADPSQSTVSVVPATILVGGEATITLTARDATGKQEGRGGLPFSLALASGSGTLSDFTDHNDGTYTAVFTGTSTGLSTINATLNNQPIISTPATILVTQGASHFQVTAPAAATLGAPASFTVTALDVNDHPIGSAYTGTIHFSSTDASASLPSDTTLTNGSGIFNATINSPGVQTISATDTVSLITGTSSPIVVSAAVTRFAVNATSTATAGSPFLVTVTAQDASGHTAIGYSGTVHITTSGGSPILPADATLTGGVGSFLVTLKSAGSFAVTARDMANTSINGTSGNIAVSPSDARFFTVIAPPSATTGAPISATVTAFDSFGNTATSYNGKLHFTSSDSSAVLPADSPLPAGVGIFNVTLNTAGSQTITVTDNLFGVPTITGTSSSITTRGLSVASVTPTATGFTAAFSKPFVPGDPTMYGNGLGTVQDATLVGSHVGAVSGSLIIDPSNMSVTFKATENSLLAFFSSPILPDDAYTVTLVSGSGTNGFLDALGAGLDGANNGGHANYTTTFTTANSSKAILSIPDFARGPDGAHVIKVPNDTAGGIPVTLSNAASVKDVVFTLNFNPTLLTPMGAGTGDSSATGSAFTMGSITNIDATHAAVTFTYHNGTAQNGTVVLGDILATVPDGAAALYKSKELLSLSSISVNGAAFTGVAAGGVHVNAYFGDVTGNGSIDGLDVATAGTVAQGKATGFAAYQLLDPAIVGDVAGDISVDAGDVSDLAAFTVHLPTPVIPVIPTGLTITPVGPDPTLSLGEPQRKGDKVTGRRGDMQTGSGSLSPSLHVSVSGIVSVPLLLDDPHPNGSTGMTEAILALTYDPSILSVSASDITLGSIPGLGVGWQLASVVDQATGRIGIRLYRTTPITTTEAGSLVNIAFHVLPGASLSATEVQLVHSVIVGGEQFATQVDDAQGQLTLSPATTQLVEITTKRTRKIRG